ncbi:MAG TPA: hydantoinase/oxoprolinase family protein [Anaerolineales bacterium]|nr:hydantoinase/oxoprolinase family protein [Anaerolineales bacterium]
MDLVLGIDTGGTFTDGVLLDYATRDVVATTKALTTRYDLSVGILNAIDSLPIAGPGAIKLASISTTLATNAIAEGKGKRVALFLIGYDADLVRAFNFGDRFATSQYFYFRGGHDFSGQEKEPLDLDGLTARACEIAEGNSADALAVSAYFSPLNPDHERRAFDAIAAVADLPIVLAHTLSTKLNSIERATTATLNASLVSVLRDFIAAVQTAMEARGIVAPLMVVRGDGTLMSAEVADHHAVETIHSGPAASAIGGRFLSGRDPALVVDIGGTTTDIAVVDGGQVTINEDGTTVGGYRTAVKAANIRSFALGGDSQLSYDKEEQLRIGPARVLPLAHLAAQHPRVHDELVGLAHKRPTESLLDSLEYWFLQRRGGGDDPQVLKLFDLLRDGPRPLGEVLKALKLTHPMQFSGYKLFEREIIGRAGLTPTDLLHVRGDFAPWDVEAARVATESFARMRRWTTEELMAQTFATMTDAILVEMIQFLTGRPLAGRDLYSLRLDLGRWFFDNSFYPNDKYLATAIKLKMPIIGIGAPAGIFLPRVAELLQTELVLPQHFAVANAVGAVAGSVVATCEALIYPRLHELQPVGYIAQVGERRENFRRLAEAVKFAQVEAARQAEAEAIRSGAASPYTQVEEIPNGADSFRIRARAVGNPRLMFK